LKIQRRVWRGPKRPLIFKLVEHIIYQTDTQDFRKEMAYINISVKKHKITPQDVDARNEPGESKAPIYNKGRHSFEWREVGVVGVGGDMRKDTYDRTDSGVVDNSEALEGYPLTQVRDHAPKGHDNTQHIYSFLTTCDKYTKAYMDLLGIDAATLEDYDLAGVRTHVPITHNNDCHSTALVTTCNKYTKAYMDLLGIDAATLGGKALGIGIGDIAFYDANGRVADVTKVKGTTVDSTNIGVGKLLAYDATTETLVYRTLAELVPALNTDGKLVLTGATQIGTKTGDLAELWDKSTKLTTVDLEATEFDLPNKIPLLDASTHLTLSQVVGNVPGLSGAGKLILTQVGTGVTDLAALWDKTTKLVTTDFDDATFNVANGMVKLDASVKVPYTLVPEVGGAATLVVAASNSENKEKADYVCTGGKGTKLCLDTGISSNIIEVSNASGITIKDLYVDGTTTAPSAGDDLKQCGILFTTVTDSKIRNVHSLSNKMHGIHIYDVSQRNTVINSTCKDNGYDGILLFDSAYNILWGCILIGNAVDGVETYWGDNNTLVANKIESNGGFGIIIGRGENNTITSNNCNNNDNDGIQVWVSDYNTVAGNSCCGGDNVGIRCANNSRCNTIFGNTVSDTKMGIYVQWGDYTVISGNSCCNNTPWDGIYATSDCLTISGNTCFNNEDNGIGSFVYGQHVVFGNSCHENTTTGINISTGLNYNTIVGNTSIENTENGIRANDTRYNTIVGNTDKSNQKYGIDLYSSSNNTVSSNTSIGNSQELDNSLDDIAIRENSDYNNIQKNTCRAGGGAVAPKYGIDIVDSNCTENFVTNNDIHNDNYGSGSLYIVPGSGTVTTAGNRTA
jgi:parallel beta-helix repeat protein